MPGTDKPLIDELDGILALHKLRIQQQRIHATEQLNCRPIRHNRRCTSAPCSDDGRFGETARIPKTLCPKPLTEAEGVLTKRAMQRAQRAITQSDRGLRRFLRGPLIKYSSGDDPRRSAPYRPSF